MNLALSPAAVMRAVGFLVLWIILTGGNPGRSWGRSRGGFGGDLDELASATARHEPRATRLPSPGLRVRFLRQSVIAGV